jgi:hypothetical protein
MSARDDSPVIANRYNITSTDEYRRALDEIDRLRAEVARLTPVVEAAKRWRADVDPVTLAARTALVADLFYAVDALAPVGLGGTQ